jgi:diguanylate cyclase (GGDEF)-like protein
VNLELFDIELFTSFTLALVATAGYLCGTLRHRRKTQRMEQDLATARSALGEIEQVKVLIQSFSSGKTACGDPACLADAGKRASGPPSSDAFVLAEVRTDSLTRLPHRDVLEQMLTTELARLGRYGTPFSLVLVDIDHLKDLNEQHGHLHGDYALQRLARLLADEVRGIDMPARASGDEFAVVLPETNEEGACVFGERLRARVQEQMPFTISVGLAAAGSIDTLSSLMDRARTALQEAKDTGRNRVCRAIAAPAVAP